MSTIFTTSQQAEASFYEALERADLELMMAVWAEDEEVVCIHPGRPRLAGYAAIRESWRRILEEGGQAHVTVSHQVISQGSLVAIHSVYENATTATGQKQAV